MGKRSNLKRLKTSWWKVIEVFEEDVPGLYDMLKDDHLVAKLHGSWKDLLIYHGDDGGWCVQVPYHGTAHKRLERIRVAAGLPAVGECFWLHIKTG